MKEKDNITEEFKSLFKNFKTDSYLKVIIKINLEKVKLMLLILISKMEVVQE